MGYLAIFYIALHYNANFWQKDSASEMKAESLYDEIVWRKQKISASAPLVKYF